MDKFLSLDIGLKPNYPPAIHRPRCRRRQLKASAGLMAADRVIMGRLRTTRFDNEDDLQPLTYLAAQILEIFFGLGGGVKKKWKMWAMNKTLVV